MKSYTKRKYQKSCKRKSCKHKPSHRIKKNDTCEIDNLYHNMSGSIADTSGYDPKYALTYGEITQTGIKKLITIFNNKKNISEYPSDRRTFYDLGSGIGKNVIIVAMSVPSITSKGIELVKDRHNMAMTVYGSLSSSLQERIQFINGSLFDYNISDAAWIFISNLCFTDEINKELSKKLIKEAQINTLIACSKELELDDSFYSLPKINIPMTWSNDSKLYFYKKST